MPPSDRPRRLLLLSASVGAGHLRAAEALEAACRGFLAPDVWDVGLLTPKPSRRIYGDRRVPA